MLVCFIFYGLKCDVLSIHCKWTKNCELPLHKTLKFIYKMYEHKQYMAWMFHGPSESVFKSKKSIVQCSES